MATCNSFCINGITQNRFLRDGEPSQMINVHFYCVASNSSLSLRTYFSVISPQLMLFVQQTTIQLRRLTARKDSIKSHARCRLHCRKPVSLMTVLYDSTLWPWIILRILHFLSFSYTSSFLCQSRSLLIKILRGHSVIVLSPFDSNAVQLATNFVEREHKTKK